LPSILLLDRRFSRALELPLELAGPAAEIQSQFKTALTNFGQEAEFLPTPEGLAILICSSGVVLWAPKEDLDKAFAEVMRSHPQPDIFGLSALTRFDRDKNGWL